MPIYRGRPSKMPLSAVLQEGPEKALCGTVKAARWQQDNIGVRLRSMTSHKKRLWHEVHIRTALKGPRSSWKSSVVNSCHWFVCHFQASKQSTSSSEMDFLKIAWRSSLVTSRWTLSVFFRHFCGPFFRFFFWGGRDSSILIYRCTGTPRPGDTNTRVH